MLQDHLHALASFLAIQPLWRGPEDRLCDVEESLERSAAVLGVLVDRHDGRVRYQRQGVEHTLLLGDFSDASGAAFLEGTARLIQEALHHPFKAEDAVAVVLFGPYLNQFEVAVDERFPGKIAGVARDNPRAARGHIYVVGVRVG